MARETVKSLKQQLANANEALNTALTASPERDDTFFPGGMSAIYDMPKAYSRRQLFAETLRAWRVNPMARRIVNLTRSFVLGKKTSLTIQNELGSRCAAPWG